MNLLDHRCEVVRHIGTMVVNKLWVGMWLLDLR